MNETATMMARYPRDMRWYAERHREFMDSIQPILAAKVRFYSLRLPQIIVFPDHVETEYNFSPDEKSYLALLRMAIYLAQAEPWVPDRHINTGPNFANPKATVTHTIVERDPGLKARVLSALQHGGPQTSEVIAKKLRLPQREVGAKLSRLFRDGHVERALSATSPHTGRKVLVYWVLGHG